MTSKVLYNPERQLTGLDFVLRRAAELYPDRIAVDDRMRACTVSYGQLRARTSQLARALQRLEVQRGDLVSYAFFNEHASVETLFACAMIGAVAVPINARLHPTEVGAYLKRLGCRLMLVNVELEHLADPEVTPTIIIRSHRRVGGNAEFDYERLLDAESDTPLQPSAYWEDPCMMAMTGGTSGPPKAAVWTHCGFLLEILSTTLALSVKRGSKSICLAPCYHAAGLGWGVMPVLWQGGTLIMPPSATFNAAFLQSELRRTPIDYLLMVPALIEPLHDVWDQAPLFSSTVCVTSAPTAPAQRLKLAKMFPSASIVAGYGMTETLSMSFQSVGEFLTMPTAVGEASAVSRIRIVDANLRTVPAGTIGQIAGRTLPMSLGYQDDETNTHRAFRTLLDDPEGLEWMLTGDIGFLDPEGRLTIVDRAKDIILTGGENVPSIEVEGIVGSHPGVRECAAIGLPDERWGERVTIVIVAREENDEEAIAREAVSLCRAQLAAYKVPKEVVFVDALPRSAVGKVLKRELIRMKYRTRFNTSGLERS